MKLSKLIECQCMWWSWDLRLRNGKHRSNISQIGAHQVIQIGIGHTPHRPPGAYSSESQFPLIFLIIINLIVDSSAGGSTNCDMDANHRRTQNVFKDRSLVEVRSLPIQPGWFWFHLMTGDCWLPASHGTKNSHGTRKSHGTSANSLSKPLTKGLSCTPAGIDWTNIRQNRLRQRQNSRSKSDEGIFATQRQRWSRSTDKKRAKNRSILSKRKNIQRMLNLVEC